jgi:HK97 family phage major capsid protein
MSESTDISAAYRDLASGLNEFKSRYNAKLEALQSSVEKLSTKAGRLALGSNQSTTDNGERKAFESFLRSGDARELKAINLAAQADGGYALPKEILAELLKVQKQSSYMRGVARVESATTPDFHLIVATNAVGASWSGETGTRSETTTPTFADVAPSFGELYAAPKASNWSLSDIPSVTDWLLAEVAEQFAVTENSAFLTGDGTNKPKGLLAGPTAATADASRAFGTIEHVPTGVAGNWPATDAGIFDLVVGVAHKLRAPYRANASWLMPTAVIERLRRVKDSAGQPIWVPGLGGSPASLLGYPVIEAEDMPAIAANSLSIAFGDMRRAYVIADRADSSLIVDPYSTKGYTSFYVAKRVGGALLDSNAIKCVKFSVS